MIKYIPYRQIDKNRYDICIQESINSRVYALSWYLDCVSEGWDLLVEGDYESVMPLPRKVKYGISYIFTPSWVQQLGVFSKQKLSENKVLEFIGAIPNKFLWIDYQLNADNQISLKSSSSKLNYVLSLQGEHADIQQGYNKNRKRISSKTPEGLYLDKKGDADVFIENYKKLNKPYSISDLAVIQLRCLCHANNKHVHVWNVFNEGIFRGGLVWLSDARRITYLVPVSDEKARQLHIPTFIINELIRDFQAQDIILDFEGSMISGVEKFYQSFGAQPESYFYLKKRII